jgi:hypothetical protein
VESVPRLLRGDGAAALLSYSPVDSRIIEEVLGSRVRVLHGATTR